MSIILTKDNLKNFKYSQSDSTQEIADCIKLIKKDDTYDDRSKEYKIKYLIDIILKEIT
jgi:hypothetical protein